ncbi:MULTISPECIES: Na+/H+ antiporter family protein [unclassified Helicobacter]|uniref:Na+/H+ antiporter family protein n=1 Tax=unclassified Helicobacter TaxID=2593540 RepID=UPI000A766812|nr:MULTISPECIES: Na+/H+ antiporter NhaC family protein [unclassified Helicobacter]
MPTLSALFTNPAFIGVLVMCALCLVRCNVLIALFASALIAGVISGASVDDTLNTLIKGMSSNLEIALSYILLGFLAAAIAKSNIIALAIHKLTHILSHRLFGSSVLFCLIIAAFACLSQNLIPVHIAFIPILIPPLLGIMNMMKLDRRAIACALTFGLKAPYITLPVGYGLFFHQTIIKEMNKNGFSITLDDTSGVLWIGGVAMLLGLIIAVVAFCARPREYRERAIEMQENRIKHTKIGFSDISIIVGAFVAFGIQIYTSSMPLGAFAGIVIMLLGRGILWRDMDNIVDDGIKLMGFIAFVMLLAAGFGEVLKSSGAVDELIRICSLVVGGKLGGAVLMLVLGLLITMGIGSSFGTISIIATFYCPLCMELGFGVESSILLVGIAAALGDAGSPASDSTMGPTSGLNADGEHDHIWDTCVPTFLAFNVPLLIAGVIGAMILG